jgi:tetratricopeptide (TPR) repeat protein
LSKLAADSVARHLVAAGRLVDEDPRAALEQARAARALGARVAVVREAVGETAYAAGEWAEAIAELRTARRMTGDDSALPMIADSERALGRADRALRLAQSEDAQALGPAERAEMRIVEAGARRDLGQLDAALLTLEDLGLDRSSVQPWSARVWYAYADLLLAAGRGDEAREWFLAAAGADPDGATDADERLLELDGIEILTDEDEYGELAGAGPEAVDADEDAADLTDDGDEDAADLTDDRDEDAAGRTDDGDEDAAGDEVTGSEPEAASAAGDCAEDPAEASLAAGAGPETADAAGDPARAGIAPDGSTPDPTEDDIAAHGITAHGITAHGITEDDLTDTPADDVVAGVPEPAAADTASAAADTGDPVARGTDPRAPEAQPGNPITLTFSDQADRSGSSE